MTDISRPHRKLKSLQYSLKRTAGEASFRVVDMFAAALLLNLPVVLSQNFRIEPGVHLVQAGQALGGRDGPLIVDVMLSFHSSFDHKTRICRGFKPVEVLQDIEAVRLAFELVDNSTILGKMSLGYDILDTCSNVDHVIELAKFISRFHSLDGCEVDCRRFLPPSTDNAGVGKTNEVLNRPKSIDRKRQGEYLPLIIGIGDSVVAQAIMPVLSEKSTAVLSHMASSQRLTEYIQRDTSHDHNYFFRVIPDDGHEVKGLIELLDHFQWTHIAAFSSRSPENAAIFSVLREVLGSTKETKPHRCLAIQGKFGREDKQTIESAAKQLSSVPNVNIVILLGDINDTLAFLKIVSSVKYRGLMDRLVWVFSSKWGREYLQLPDGHPSISLISRLKHAFFLEPVPALEHAANGQKWSKIEEDLRGRLQALTPETNNETFNPWFDMAWNATGGCTTSLDDMQRPGSGADSLESQENSACTPSFKKQTHIHLGRSLLLMEACFQAAMAINDMVTHYLHHDCEMTSGPTVSWRDFVQQVLRDSSFKWNKIDPTNKDSAVNKEHECSKLIREMLAHKNLTGADSMRARYKINFLHNETKMAQHALEIMHFGYWSPATGIVLSDKKNHLASSKILKNIKSYCPSTCSAGERQAFDYEAYARRCCWGECYPCTGRTFSNSSNSQNCENCRQGERPNSNHTACSLYKLTQTADSVSSVVVVIFATLGSVVAMLTVILFHRHRETFIVKTADITLSTVMLAFQVLSFLSVAFLLVEPSKPVCISQVLLTLPWPMLYVGCILVKTNRLRVLFRRTGKLTSRRLLLLSNQTQVLFVTVVGVFTGSYLIAWVSIETPYRGIMYTTDSIDYTCSRDKAWMGVYFSGIVCLLLVSLFLSFQARNLPSDFNEASFLLLSTCSITFLWVILVPAYYASNNIKPDTLLALIITGQGIVTLLCLFTRRLYYIICPRSEEEMRSRKMLSKSPSRTRVIAMSRASSTSLRSRNSDINRSSIAEAQAQVDGKKQSENSEKASSTIQHSKDFSGGGTVCATDEVEL